MAQRSGRDWKREKLQKYLSAKSFGKEVKSSGMRFRLLAMWFTSRAMLQNKRSILARDLRSSRPRLNRLRASSRISCASCHISNDELLVSSSHDSYSSLMSSWSLSSGSSLSSHSGREVFSSTSKISTEWWAVKARPDSQMTLGWGRSFLSQASTMV